MPTALHFRNKGKISFDEVALGAGLLEGIFLFQPFWGVGVYYSVKYFMEEKVDKKQTEQIVSEYLKEI